MAFTHEFIVSNKMQLMVEWMH